MRNSAMRTAIGQAMPERGDEQDQERHQAERRPFVVDEPADQKPQNCNVMVVSA